MQDLDEEKYKILMKVLIKKEHTKAQVVISDMSKGNPT